MTILAGSPSRTSHTTSHPILSTEMNISLVILTVLASVVLAVVPDRASFTFGGRSFDNRLTWLKCTNSHVDIALDPKVDDYGAVISARLADMARRGGGSVRLLNGVYKIASPVIFANNTCLLGQSINGVVLKVIDKAPKMERRGVLHGMYVMNVTIRDLTVDANKMGQDDEKCENELSKYGTYFEASHYIWFNNVRVRNACSYGFDFPGNDFVNSTHVVVEKSFTDSAGRDGIKVFRSEKVSILHCVSVNNGRHAVSVAASETILLEGNTLSSDGAVNKFDGCGILLSDRDGVWSNGVLAIHNRVHNAYRAGICLGKVSDVKIADSSITNTRRPKAPCYEVDGAKNYEIVGGSCSAKIQIEVTHGSDEKEAETKKAQNVANSGSSVSKCKGMGIEKSGVCCPSVCGICGGVGCSKRAPYGACCVKKIRKAGNLCRDGPPPCNL